MHLASATIVATLLYKEPMSSEFQDLIEQFDEAFRSRPRASYHHGRPYDDFATFQIDGARVVLAYCDQPTDGAPDAAGSFGAGHRAGLVLAVSFGVNEGQPLVLAGRREALCRSIAEKVAARYPADMTLWSETGGEFGPDEFDGIVRSICQVQMEAAAAPDETAAAEAEPAEAEAPEVLADAPPAATDPAPADLPKAGGRHSAARLAAARSRAKLRPAKSAPAQHDHAQSDHANSLPDLPHPMLSEAARIREALYVGEQEDRGRAPLVQRLTLYSMNMTLIMVAAPVGAALLTYNALGREDLRLTARAMALTGVVVALSQTGLGAALATMI